MWRGVCRCGNNVLFRINIISSQNSCRFRCGLYRCHVMHLAVPVVNRHNRLISCVYCAGTKQLMSPALYAHLRLGNGMILHIPDRFMDCYWWFICRWIMLTDAFVNQVASIMNHTMYWVTKFLVHYKYHSTSMMTWIGQCKNNVPVSVIQVVLLMQSCT